MHNLDLTRRLALHADETARARGPQGRTRVRPAAQLGQPYDVLRLWFPQEYLTLAPGSGTAYASTAYLPLNPPLALSQYSLVWPEPLGIDIDDAKLGGAFAAFLSLQLDDDTEAGLSGTQVLCDGSGAVTVSGPVPNAPQEFAPGKKVKAARLRLQADGPGSATATLAAGRLDVYLFRARLGQTLEFPK